MRIAAIVFALFALSQIILSYAHADAPPAKPATQPAPPPPPPPTNPCLDHACAGSY